VLPTSHIWFRALSGTLAALLLAETAFAVFIYLPHKTRLKRLAEYPPPLTSEEREALFERCVANIPNLERYLQVWFLGTDISEIKRDNVRDFLLWAFFERDGGGPASYVDEETSFSHEEELEGYICRVEAILGWQLPPGRGAATPLRLTIDPIFIRYHSVIWYAIIGLVDLATHTVLRFHGFAYHSPAVRTSSTFPPTPALRAVPLPGVSRRVSPSSSLAYWHRPHSSTTHLPVVFIHGIGIGLWPYASFFADLNPSSSGDNQIGIIALEILPISARLTAPPLTRPAFIAQLNAILAAHSPDWKRFVLVSHSYGSVLTTHILRDSLLGPRVEAAVLVDPVSILLHLPDVAYNFTRRPPRRANEWQLWYFASMDAGVAEGLGRHFFWRENIIWREELVAVSGNGEEVQGATKKRKVAVSLAGRDLIVDTRTVARYLATEGDFSKVPEEDVFPVHIHQNHLTPSGVEILWFPGLDHAQVFEKRSHRERVVEVVRRYCLVDDALI